MTNPDNSVYLKHILDSILKIEKYVAGYTFDQFANDDKTVSAVLRELSIIGEAAARTASEFQANHPTINWKEIFGMRNKLVHDYLGVKLDIVWNTIQENLPPLKDQVQAILAI